MSTGSNTFLQGSLGLVYARTALPIIAVMALNGLLAVVDAVFLGHFAGADALAAVTLMFPPYMLIVALATLVSAGMSSILARHLGADRVEDARATFAAAHGMALCMGFVLIVLFLSSGDAVALAAAGGSANLAELGLIYLRITVFAAPLVFVLSVNSDALRCEGRVGLMAAISLFVSLSNMGFNAILIGALGLGVAGSALGTALAQAIAMILLLTFRLRGKTALRPSVMLTHSLLRGWRPILALGVPQSLNFIGLALGSGAILVALQWVGTPTYDATVSAYGIITRIITFAFLPLLGLASAMQTITGNTYGAGAFDRSDDSLRVAIGFSLVYCLTIQIIVTAGAAPIAAAFVDDPVVIAEVGRILPILSAGFVLSGPLMMVAMHFQAIGDAGRAAILGLSKPYLFAIPLTFALAGTIGERGIWLAAPLAEGFLLALTALVLSRVARRQALRWGLFQPLKEAAI